MTLKIKSLNIDDKGNITSEYIIVHSDQKTALDQNVRFIYNSYSDKFTCEFNITDFPNMDSFEDAKEKLAAWFERLAKGLREPTEALDMPLYSGVKK